MADKPKLKFIDAGFRAVLNSAGCRAMIEGQAARIRQKAGPNFHYRVRKSGIGGGRWIAYVGGNQAGDLEEATNKVLTRAVGA